MQIREASSMDAAEVIEFFQQLYAESNFMLYEPGEAVPTEAEQVQRMERLSADHGVMFLCEVAGQIIGACYGQRGQAKRSRHSLYIVIGVLQAWSGQGAGRLLMQHLERWAQSRAMHRLELMVRVDNQRAIALYEKLGYAREGVLQHSLLIEGQYVDELSMAKLLSD